MAETSGGRLLGDVVTSTDEVPERPVDRGEVDRPAFDAFAAGRSLRSA